LFFLSFSKRPSINYVMSDLEEGPRREGQSTFGDDLIYRRSLL